MWLIRSPQFVSLHKVYTCIRYHCLSMFNSCNKTPKDKKKTKKNNDNVLWNWITFLPWNFGFLSIHCSLTAPFFKKKNSLQTTVMSKSMGKTRRQTKLYSLHSKRFFFCLTSSSFDQKFPLFLIRSKHWFPMLAPVRIWVPFVLVINGWFSCMVAKCLCINGFTNNRMKIILESC